MKNATELQPVDLIRLAAQSALGLVYLAAALIFTLLAGLVLWTTAEDISRQGDLVEGAQAFHTDSSEARVKLLALRTQGQVDGSLLLAAYEYERSRDLEGLETAEGLFKEVLAADPGRTSAVVGLAATRLRKAELQGGLAGLKSAAPEVASLLNDARDKSQPDLAFLQAALDVLGGKPGEAVTALSADPSTAPSKEGTGARWWNLAVAQILAKVDPLPAAARAYTLRPRLLPAEDSRERDESEELSADGDPERLLILAYRFSLCSKECGSQDAEALGARVEFGRRLSDQSFTRAVGQEGRYSPHRTDAARVFNALGVGLCRVERYQDAIAAFTRATRTAGKPDPLYSLNSALAATLALPRLKGESKDVRKNVLDAAVLGYRAVAEQVHGDKRRASTLKLAVDNALSVNYDLDPQDGLVMLRKYQKEYPSEVDWNRHMGALLDWQRRIGCIPHYRKALELGHPDSVGIKERLKLWEAVK